MKQPLADFDKGNGFAKGWRMAVGECFRDSLDIMSIKQTHEATDVEADEIVFGEPVAKWTQGGTFSFSQGDTVYDTPRAYQRWDIALNSIRVAYQVLAATPSRPKKELIYLKRHTSFAGCLAGGQEARRQEVLKAIPPDWMEERKIVETVEEATRKAPSPGLLQKLCEIGALKRRVDSEPRSPGIVRFQVLMPNADRSKLFVKEEVVTSQDGFIAFLITGRG
jgi:hypothetical protein